MYSERFKAIEQRAIARPNNAEDLMDVKGFVDSAERLVEEIMVDVRRTRTQVMFLLDNAYTLTDTDVELNSKTFTWPARLGTNVCVNTEP